MNSLRRKEVFNAFLSVFFFFLEWLSLSVKFLLTQRGSRILQDLSALEKTESERQEEF